MRISRLLSSMRNGQMILKRELMKSLETTQRLIWTGEDGHQCHSEETKLSFITNESNDFNGILKVI